MNRARQSGDTPSPLRLNRRAIPNVPVVAHDGRTYRFYEDLVRDRTVLVSFMSIAHDAHYPSTSKMAEVLSILERQPMQETGSRPRLLSITVDPEHDTPRRLAAYAPRICATPGDERSSTPSPERWLFLSATREDMEALRASFYVHRTLAPVDGARRLYTRRDLLSLPKAKAVMDCSMGLLRYGNEALDLWGGAPVRAAAQDIVTRLAWVSGARNTDATQPRRRRSGRALARNDDRGGMRWER